VLDVEAIANVALSSSLIDVVFDVFPNVVAVLFVLRFPNVRPTVSVPSSNVSCNTANVVFLVVPVEAPPLNVTVCVPNAV
jgi:hypothetical protein